jgi:hypothetical protein
MSRGAIVPASLMLSNALLGPAPSIPLSPKHPELTSIEAAVKAAYQRKFGRTIEHSAIYNNPQAINCRGEGRVTTTAYLRTATTTTLLSLYMSRDGATVTQKNKSAVRPVPAGKIHVLVILLRYPQTVAANVLSLWEAAQKDTNQDHAAFATSRGYNAPIVVFDNTNILIDPARIGNSPRSLRVSRSPTTKSVGGFALPEERSVYVGNYSSWKTLLGASQWEMIALPSHVLRAIPSGEPLHGVGGLTMRKSAI